MHQQDKTLVHGDLKPTNVFVEDNLETRAKLGDFGLSRFLYKTEQAMGGSLRWMAPEIATGHDRSPSCAADVFSLGALLSFTLTDVKPFEGVDRNQILKMMCRGSVPALTWPSTEEDECVLRIALLGDSCYSMNPVKRPDIMQVLEVLEMCRGLGAEVEGPLLAARIVDEISSQIQEVLAATRTASKKATAALLAQKRDLDRGGKRQEADAEASTVVEEVATQIAEVLARLRSATKKDKPGLLAHKRELENLPKYVNALRYLEDRVTERQRKRQEEPTEYRTSEGRPWNLALCLATALVPCAGQALIPDVTGLFQSQMSTKPMTADSQFQQPVMPMFPQQFLQPMQMPYVSALQMPDGNLRGAPAMPMSSSYQSPVSNMWPMMPAYQPSTPTSFYQQEIALEQQLMSMNNQLQQLKKEERKLTLEKFLLGFYQIHQKLHNNS
eukprot:g4228.t1